MEGALPLGKLPGGLLARLLARYATPDERLLVAPGVGRDAAAIALDDERALVVKSDPITFATAEIGWYLVNVNANDLACLGVSPRWLLVTALLPEGRSTPASVEAIFAGLADACAPLGITLAGGHTEITHRLDRPILVGTLLGETARADLVAPGDARPGDVVLATKGVAVEGTALIALERGEEIAARHGADFAARCRAFLREPGISVVRDAAVARAAGAVHALHDPTEGGIATGLRELALAAGLGIVVDAAAIPVYHETARLCADYGLDPLGLIASGALLIAAPPADAEAIAVALRAAGIAATAVGRLTPPDEGLRLRRDGRDGPLPEFSSDEVTRLFGA
ncbi:MAG TPA: AIR synthase-related protein [Thermomicrobiales bacterium]|nr:AIR synthase-related protein [Thermomicrobiales bacterium]